MERQLVSAALIVILLVGFALLALSQARHWRTVAARSPLPRTATIIVRLLGLALLAVALPIALWRDGTGFGSLLWALLLSLAACAVTLTLSWRPGWLKPLALAIHAATVVMGKAAKRSG